MEELEVVKIDTIPGFLSFEEAKRNLLHIATSIFNMAPDKYDKHTLSLSLKIRLHSIESLTSLLKDYLKQLDE